MSAPKHSLGPWRLTYMSAQEQRDFFKPEALRVISAPNWHMMAAVVVRTNGQPSAQGEANARLLRAAPELLAALRGVLAHQRPLDPIAPDYQDEYAAHVAACSAALEAIESATVDQPEAQS